VLLLLLYLRFSRLSKIQFVGLCPVTTRCAVIGDYRRVEGTTCCHIRESIIQDALSQ
jgi:hypothetical protein